MLDAVHLLADSYLCVPVGRKATIFLVFACWKTSSWYGLGGSDTSSPYFDPLIFVQVLQQIYNRFVQVLQQIYIRLRQTVARIRVIRMHEIKVDVSETIIVAMSHVTLNLIIFWRATNPMSDQSTGQSTNRTIELLLHCFTKRLLPDLQVVNLGSLALSESFLSAKWGINSRKFS